MIGQTWKSEIRAFKDAKTGRTRPAAHVHGQQLPSLLYRELVRRATNEIIFLSDRASGEDKAPHEIRTITSFAWTWTRARSCS